MFSLCRLPKDGHHLHVQLFVVIFRDNFRMQILTYFVKHIKKTLKQYLDLLFVNNCVMKLSLAAKQRKNMRIFPTRLSVIFISHSDSNNSNTQRM